MASTSLSVLWLLEYRNILTYTQGQGPVDRKGQGYIGLVNLKYRYRYLYEYSIIPVLCLHRNLLRDLESIPLSPIFSEESRVGGLVFIREILSCLFVQTAGRTAGVRLG